MNIVRCYRFDYLGEANMDRDSEDLVIFLIPVAAFLPFGSIPAVS